MLQKTGEPNPLNFFGIRKVQKPLPHFTYLQTKFDYGMEDKINNWIRINLKSRYFLEKTIKSSHEHKVEYVIKIGFEDAKELTIFTLSCPYVNRS